MSAKLFTIILIRLISVYVLLQAASILPVSITVSTPEPMMLLFDPTFIMTILAIVLWLIAPKAATMIIKGYDDHSTTTISLSNAHIESLIFLAVGLILVTSSVPSIFGTLAFTATLDQQMMDTSMKAQLTSGSTSTFVREGITLFIGVFLIVFAQRLGTLFKSAFSKE